jgi:hypothetical protein
VLAIISRDFSYMGLMISKLYLMDIKFNLLYIYIFNVT